ncbi:MAG: type II toxin-antitoxin system Phd/YefM family antitoxin [Lachnospiraceae bacterium]|nr:type II toxin-antitoxin system Phd/YefM family antitoxin [Lachnospiraceae bacterium]
MPKIIPIKDLKNTSQISELCHVAEEPVYITKNGYGDMVIMSLNLFEKMQKEIREWQEVEISEQQIQKSETKPAIEALAAMRRKHGV